MRFSDYRRLGALRIFFPYLSLRHYFSFSILGPLHADRQKRSIDTLLILSRTDKIENNIVTKANLHHEIDDGAPCTKRFPSSDSSIHRSTLVARFRFHVFFFFCPTLIDDQKSIRFVHVLQTETRSSPKCNIGKGFRFHVFTRYKSICTCLLAASASSYQ